MTVGEGECYYIKSHRKYSVIPYPARRSKDEWAFKIDPVCQILRVQFEPAFFGIDGDAFRCEIHIFFFSLSFPQNERKIYQFYSVCIFFEESVFTFQFLINKINNVFDIHA